MLSTRTPPSLRVCRKRVGTAQAVALALLIRSDSPYHLITNERLFRTVLENEFSEVFAPKPPLAGKISGKGTLSNRKSVV